MSGGALIQLVGSGEQNMALNLRNVAYDYHTFGSEGTNNLIISRLSDMVTLDYLELTFLNTEINNLNDVKNLILYMKIGGQIIQQYPLNLLINLNEPILCDGKMYINLCPDMFFKDIKIAGLTHHEVSLSFKDSTWLNCITRYGLVSKLTYVDNEE